MKHSESKYTDDEVISRVTGGETALFEIIIRRYNPYLYRIGRSYHYNHADTEDLMQDSYVQAYFSLKNFEKRASFKTWITRIMLNNCYQKKQRLRYRKEVLAEVGGYEDRAPLFHQTSNSEKIMVNKELGNLLEGALNLIPEDYRVVFTLRELNGLSVADTHHALGITESNVKVRLNRAKQMLRTEIEKMYSPEEIYEFNLRYCDGMVERVMARIAGQAPDHPVV
ncbi:MAG: sigma-70 family RNA polymerase sigma factor [Bacteroidota bacterium]|nr:sigma-70 family RNA polymerase sigma factor [Bacteroidota bacterium]